jgi:glutamate decarboxylase
MLSEKRDLGKMKKSERKYTTTYGSRYFSESIPKYEMPEDGMPAKAAYQLINEELNLDGIQF